MKLRNKKTGEIISFFEVFNYNSLSELTNEWEDYEEPKEYWYIYADKPQRADCGDILEEDFKAIGNYFETKEEAENAVEKLKAWKRLEDKGFRFDGRNKPNYGEKFIVECSLPKETLVIDVAEDLDLIFGGEE